MDNRPKRFKEIDNSYTLESIEKDKYEKIKLWKNILCRYCI